MAVCSMQNIKYPIQSVCVYCGSQTGNSPVYVEAAKLLGKSLAEHGIRLVYGGGTKGIMGTVARAVIEHGGSVTGIIPTFLIDQEASRHELGELSEVIVVNDMHERKQMMFERSDAFVTLPGGVGTLEEISEIMTWAQIGRHTKPMVLANVDGFWKPLLELMHHMQVEGFIHHANMLRPMLIDRPEEIVPALIEYATAQANPQGDPEIIKKL
jgi:uncharacterized protein (TIGR00730 family)